MAEPSGKAVDSCKMVVREKRGALGWRYCMNVARLKHKGWESPTIFIVQFWDERSPLRKARPTLDWGELRTLPGMYSVRIYALY